MNVPFYIHKLTTKNLIYMSWMNEKMHVKVKYDFIYLQSKLSLSYITIYYIFEISEKP